MLDLHVHVLPGIDDGPRTLEAALALARALADDGIEHIVATPHIYPGVFDNSAALIGEAFDSFQSAVSEAGIDLTMTWAAEVRICPEILEWIELRRLPMLNGSLVGPSTALIELPDGQIPVGTDKLMGLMLERGITPLMAHPERNKAVMEQPNRLEALRRLGCKFQLTAGSVLGDFGSRAQTTAQKLLDAGWVDVIATDAHNLSSRRPRMGAARDWITQHFDEALALRLTKTQPTDIAGVSSFAFQAGEQKLVFRDLPSSALPDEATPWAMDLTLDAVDTPELEALHPTDTPQDSSWSLIDFRIDALVADLQGSSLHTDPSSLDSQTPTAAPSVAPDQAEDWLLPTFQPPPSPERPPAAPLAQAAAPAPVQAPAPAPPPAPAPQVAPPAPARVIPVVAQVRAPEMTLPPVAPSEPPVVVAPPLPLPPTPPLPSPRIPPPDAVPVLEVIVTAPVASPAAPPRGLRLSELAQQPELPRPLPPQATRDPRAIAHTASSMAHAGRQVATLPVISTSAALAAARQSNETAATTPTASDPRRGFRLSDLKPLLNNIPRR